LSNCKKLAFTNIALSAKGGKMNKLVRKTKAIGEEIITGIKNFWNDESGMGTVEVILIIVVLIGLVIVFKEQISGIVEDVFKTIRQETRAVTN
jgi:Flp pilus assembly pilin Flp